MTLPAGPADRAGPSAPLAASAAWLVIGLVGAAAAAWLRSRSREADLRRRTARRLAPFPRERGA